MTEMDQSAPESPTVLLDIDADTGIARLTLNRPNALNAISVNLAQSLLAACQELSIRPDVRVVILAGAGERAFCAGADLRERRGLNATQRTAHTVAIEAAAEALAALPMPTIAAIRGYALAGGSELAVACDLRIAATDAVLGFPEVKIGIFPGAGGVLRLPRIVGRGAARDLLFTGRQIGAPDAYRIGLVDRLVAPDAVMQSANDLATAIAANAPLGVRAVKAALFASDDLPYAEARLAVNALRAALDGTADYEEGLLAFAEKRAPQFSGR